MTPASMKCVQVATTVSLPGQSRRLSSEPVQRNSVSWMGEVPCPNEAPVVTFAPVQICELIHVNRTESTTTEK